MLVQLRRDLSVRKEGRMSGRRRDAAVRVCTYIARSCTKSIPRVRAVPSDEAGSNLYIAAETNTTFMPPSIFVPVHSVDSNPDSNEAFSTAKTINEPA